MPDGTWPDGFCPALTATDVGPMLPGIVPVAGWAVEAVTLALADLATRIETDRNSLRGRGNGLMLTFDIAEEYLDEWAFFAKSREQGQDVTDAVRTLLQACTGTIRSRGIILKPENGTKAGPMGARWTG